MDLKGSAVGDRRSSAATVSKITQFAKKKSNGGT